jgi:hypothetical protein
VESVPLESVPADTRQAVLVGDWKGDDGAWTALLRRVARGDTAVFLSPSAFKRGDDPVGRLPLANKGGLTAFSDWLYHKECVAKKHPLFEGLAPKGVMDWDYYGPIITNLFFEGQDTPDDTAAAAFAVCHSSRPDGFAAGVMLGTYAFGEGTILLNTFNVLDNLDRHPAADRLLLNMVAQAAQTAGQPSAHLPQDFDATLKAVGY